MANVKTEGVIWITGLSGSGKSTIACLLAGSYRRRGVNPILLDGDAIRALVPQRLDYSEVDRRQLALFYAKLCRELAAQHHLVICATISLFKEVHAWNRKYIGNYFEVWLRVPLEELIRRDRKGIYQGPHVTTAPLAGRGDCPAEMPERPDLIVENFGATTPQVGCEHILAALESLNR